MATPDVQDILANFEFRNQIPRLSKADVLGLWNIRYAQQHKLITTFDEKSLYSTYAGLMFRSMRSGIEEAHGRGTAVQWNWIREHNGITPMADGKYTVDNLCDGCSQQNDCEIQCPSPGDPRVPDGSPFTNYPLRGGE